MSPLLIAAVVTTALGAQAPQPLRIVVIAGEDAVNVIQQKSAVITAAEAAAGTFTLTTTNPRAAADREALSNQVDEAIDGCARI